MQVKNPHFSSTPAVLGANKPLARLYVFKMAEEWFYMQLTLFKCLFY